MKRDTWLLIGGVAVASYFLVPQVRKTVDDALASTASSSAEAATSGALMGAVGATSSAVNGAIGTAENDVLGLFRSGGLFSNNGLFASIVKKIESVPNAIQNLVPATPQTTPQTSATPHADSQIIFSTPASIAAGAANALTAVPSTGPNTVYYTPPGPVTSSGFTPASIGITGQASGGGLNSVILGTPIGSNGGNVYVSPSVVLAQGGLIPGQILDTSISNSSNSNALAQAQALINN